METGDSNTQALRRLLGTLAAPAAPPAPQPGALGDVGRETAGGLGVGVGSTLTGAGEFANDASRAVPKAKRVIDVGDTLKRAGAGVSAAAQRLMAGESDAAQAAKEGSQPTVDLAHPIDTFSLGKNPSLRGYGLLAANLLGQAAPIMATARMGRAGAALSPATGALMGGGMASQQENERIGAMPEEELAALPGYQKRIKAGMTPEQARADLASETGASAFRYTAPTGALSALSEGLPLTELGQTGLSKLVGTSRAARALTGGTLAGLTGAAHGAAFGAAQELGGKAETGETPDVSRAAGDMALIGGIPGAAAGVLGGMRGVHGQEAAPGQEVGGEQPGQPGQPEAPPVVPGAGPQEQAAAARANPPPPAPPRQPAVAAVQPAFKAGATLPTGEVHVAPGVVVDPAAGPLSRTVAQAAQTGAMDKPAVGTMEDGTQFDPATGEVLATPEAAAGGEAKPPEAPKREKPTPDALDQIVLERLQSMPLLDGRTSALMAKNLGVTLAEFSNAKKRVRKFLADQADENPKDKTLGVDNAAIQHERGVDGSEEPAAVSGTEQGDVEAARGGGDAAAAVLPEPVPEHGHDLAKALSKTDRATGPDGAKYIVSKNADGEGYHFTRTEQDSTTQHKSNDPEIAWTRSEAITVAAIMAKEKADAQSQRVDGDQAKGLPPDQGRKPAAAVPKEPGADHAAPHAEGKPAGKPDVQADRPAEKAGQAGAVPAPVPGSDTARGEPGSVRGAASDELTAARVAWAQSHTEENRKRLQAAQGKADPYAAAAQTWGNLDAAAKRTALRTTGARRGLTDRVLWDNLKPGEKAKIAAHLADRKPDAPVAHRHDNWETDVLAARRYADDLGIASSAHKTHAQLVPEIKALVAKRKAAGMKMFGALLDAADTTKDSATGKPLTGWTDKRRPWEMSPEEFVADRRAHLEGKDGRKVGSDFAMMAGASWQEIVKRAIERGEKVPDENRKLVEGSPDASTVRGNQEKPAPAKPEGTAGADQNQRGADLQREPEGARAGNEPGVREAGKGGEAADGKVAAALNFVRWMRESQNVARPQDMRSGIHDGHTFHVIEHKPGEAKRIEVDGPNGHVVKIADLWKQADEGAAAPAPKSDPVHGGATVTPPKIQTSKNTIFTDDAKAKALDVLRKKRGQLNAGIDPELFTAAATVAGWHIENGARKFGAFARGMVDDIGDWIKPHLAGMYEYIRRNPDLKQYAKDMTPTAEVDASDAAGIPELNEEKPREAQGEKGVATEQERANDGSAGGPAADRTAAGEPAVGGEQRRDTGNAAAADSETRTGRERARGGAGAEEEGQAAAEEGQGNASAHGGVTGADQGERDANVRRKLADDGGPAALAPAPAAPVQAHGERGDAGDLFAAGGAGNPKSHERADEGGRDRARGVDGEPGGAPDTESARVQSARDSVAKDVAERKVGVQQTDGARPSNFVIARDFPLGEGGAKTKAATNLEAVRLLKTIESEGRNATPAEQAVLARYVGWGGIPQAFAHETKGATKGWEKLVADVEKHLTPEELAAARRSTQDAHYTSREVVNGVYHALEHIGLRGGLTLEPAMGTGNFLGMVPAALRGGLRWKGVELDSITGRIARQLYPEANIIAGKGFQDVPLPENHFDAVVGNPPFGKTTLFDPTNKDLKGFSIHNFFFAKSIKALKPGGVLGMVVSHLMLDKLGSKQRDWLAKHARLLGAVRLPNDAFKKNAGTEVTTDIVFLQKLHPGETADRSWTQVGEVPDPAGGDPIPVNQYFVDHPEMLLGKMTRQGKMRGKLEPTLSPDGRDLEAAIRAAAEHLPRDVLHAPAPVRPSDNEPYADVAPGVPVYGHYVDDNGAIRQRLPDEFDKPVSRVVELSGRDVDRVKSMIDLRDRYNGLIRAERSEIASMAIEAQRKALNRAYDAFVKKFGYVNKQYNTNLFRDDPGAYRIRGLEKGYQVLKHADAIAAGLEVPSGRKSVEVASKADILSRRVFNPEKAPKADNAADALGISLNTHGRVNLDAMADMLGKSHEDIVRELGDKLFNDPKHGYVTDDEYLSGNVKAKLAEAKAMARKDPEFERNVRALEAVQPADINPADIYVALGSPWVNGDHYAKFAQEKLEMHDARLSYIPQLSTFTLGGYAKGHDKFGTKELSARKIFEKVVNRAPIEVFETTIVDGKERRTLNVDATNAAQAAAEMMRQEFADWVWKDDARRNELSRIYNDTYNTDVQRQYAADVLSFPGKVDDAIFGFYPSQKRAIWRGVQDGKVLLDHVVGAGKTAAAIAMTMKKRQMGLARKPMVAVPNHLVQQWAADWMKIYPGANILAAGKADFEKDKRKLLFSRIATGDWDAVIVPHSQFSRIEPPADFEQRYMQERIEEFEDAIDLARNAGEDKRTVKKIEQARDQMKEKLKAKLEGIKRDTDTAHFDEMGIDDLTIDEAHEFKNLGFVTRKRNVSGMGSAANGGSQKAEDLFIKSRYLDELNGGRGLSFLTGTPVSNSLAEMFTMQRYLNYNDLKARGIHLFDAWANTFAAEETSFELDSSGRGLKPKTVLKKFLNAPEMMQLYKRFADTITLADLKKNHKEQTGKDWPTPNIEGGKPQNTVVQPGPALLSYIEGNIIPRMQAISGEGGRRKPDPKVDNMLKVTNDARKAALDIRLLRPTAADDPQSKPNVTVRRILDIAKRTAKDKGTQLVFCDLSTPKAAVARERAELMDLRRRADEGDEDAQEKLDNMNPDDVLALESSFSVYDDMKAKLIAAGMPEREIAFIHDANTDQQKKQLFDKVNRGDVRVLFGSTAKMGAGTNVQERLVHLHHLDAPWRPSDLEQREGRIIRQGNSLAFDKDGKPIPGFEIGISRYATERTYDSRMWQLIERKSSIVDQIRKGDSTMREFEDVGGETANAAEMKAAATGNPLLIEQVEVDAKVKKLSSLKRSFDARVYDAKAEIGRRESELAAGGHFDQMDQRAASAQKVLDVNPARPFSVTVDDKAYAQKDEKDKDAIKDGAIALATKAVDAVAQWQKTTNYTPVELGRYRGASIILSRDMGFEKVHVKYDRLGDVGQTPLFTTMDRQLSPHGFLTRLDNIVDDMGTWAQGAKGARDRAVKRIGELTDVANQQFKQADELKTAQDRLKEINAQLVKAVEDAKKAPAPAPTVATDEAPESFDMSAAPRAGRQPELRTAEGVKILGFARANAAKFKAAGVHVFVLDGAHQLPDPKAEHVKAGHYDMARGLWRARKDGGANVYLFANNVRTLEQAKRTLAHEIVGHFGMEKLLGDDFAKVAADALALVRSSDKYTEIRQRVARYSNMGEATMAKEALAMMAEGGYKNGVLARVYAAIRTFLRKLGLDLNYSAGDINELVRAAAGNLADAGKAERLAATPGAPRSPFAEAFDLADGQTLSDVPPDRVHEAIKDAANLHLRGIPDAIVAKVTDWKPALLGALTLRQMADIAGEYLPHVKDYADSMQRMLTRRNQVEQTFVPTAKKWEAFQRAARKAATAAQRKAGDTDSDRLTAVMHDATLSGVDPDKEFQPAVVKLASGEGIAATDAAAIADKLTKRASSLSGSARAVLLRDIDRLRDAAASEVGRVAAHPELVKRFAALPEKAKEVYREARDLYAKQADDMLAALVGRVDSLDVPKAEKTSLTNQIRAHFESARVQAPYFPLARFGEYWVSAEKDGKREFRMMESRAQQKRIADAYRASGYEANVGTKLDTVRAQDGASGSFMASVVKTLRDAGVPNDAADEIYQLYLRTLPELSVRRNFIHRKGTPGYDSDALRAFSAHAQHGSYQLARTEHAPALERLMRAMKEQTFELSKSGDDANAVAAGRMYDEMLKRHQWIMNPTHNLAVQKLTSASFVWYLAASPAQALVNMTQNAITAFPVLSAKHGFGKAMVELTKGMSQSLRTYGHTEKMLTGDEARAYQALVDMGAIDRTFVHDIAGLGDADTRDYSDTRHRVMATLSHLFHKSEVFNRESTGMAAYRLERAAGATHADAVKAAADVIWESHFDYSNANRARVMQGSLGKLAFAMKQYSQNMTYFLWRNLYQSMKGADAETRSMARRKLVGTLGMTAVFSGTLGLPLMSMMFAAANGAHALFGDPDEPFDAETEFRNFLADHLGSDLGRTAATGLVNEATGLDFASRTRLDQMWYRDADKEQEGRNAADYVLEQIAGPVGNMLLLNPFTAAQRVGHGQYERAAETLVPKFIRDQLRGFRYGSEGVNDMRGNSIVPDLSPFELAGQAAGFAPARVSEQYAINESMQNFKADLQNRRKAIIDGYAMAMRLNDTDGVRAALDQIKAFNGKNPELAISGNALRRMLQSKEKFNERAVHGLVLGKKYDSQVRAGVRFEDDDEPATPDRPPQAPEAEAQQATGF